MLIQMIQQVMILHIQSQMSCHDMLKTVTLLSQYFWSTSIIWFLHILNYEAINSLLNGSQGFVDVLTDSVN